MITITKVSYQVGKLTILKEVDLQIDTGQVVALIGPNGAGKSTLFSLMARINHLQTGEIKIGGQDIAKTNPNVLAKTVAMLAQDNHIQGRLRVQELLMFGRYPYHQGRPTASDEKVVEAILDEFELTALANRFLSELSGGQRQRALIAMSVCQDTPYLLLDEPLNNLDMYHAGKLMRKMRQLAQTGKTIVIVLHDINQAAQFADSVVMLKSGQVVTQGKPSDVLTVERIKELYHVEVTVLQHNGRVVVVDEL